MKELLQQLREDPLTRLLLERKLLTERELVGFSQQARAAGIALEDHLQKANVFQRHDLLEMLENQYFTPAVDLAAFAYDPEVLRRVPRRLAERHVVLPLTHRDGVLEVAFAEPDNEAAADALAHWTLCKIERRVALRSALQRRIAADYDRLEAEGATSEPSRIGRAQRRSAPPRSVSRPGSPPTPAAPPERTAAAKGAGDSARLGAISWGDEPVAIVDAMIATANDRGATDIHVEPKKDHLKVRFRVDGILQEITRLPRAQAAAVVSRLKVISKMDIAERRVPQDGRFSKELGQEILDFRVSSLPAQFGEKIVLRMLRKTRTLLDLDKLKMPPEIRALHDEMIQNPLGFYLVTGPTGSGKTTTLYATLGALDRDELNIITLEDPIEYSLDGITQVQINETAGLTFASGLESILRQDPDVVLVGEIRNSETVEIACRAALTGHKVFSTLHTNDATQAVTRLIDMGVVPYLITATLRGVLTQRLVRLVCTACSEFYEANDTERALLGHTETSQLIRGRGCDDCAGTGYRGRMALFEYFKMEEELHRLILDRASSTALRHAAESRGMITLVDQARKAVLDGLTTVAEIQRAVFSDHGQEQLCTSCKRVISVEFSVCPFCQYVLQESCPRCRQRVEAVWDVCAHCGFEITREWKRRYCAQCDAPMNESWTQCPYCGGGTSG